MYLRLRIVPLLSSVPSKVMLLPSGSLPASTTLAPFTVSCRLVSTKQSAAELVTPTRFPSASGLITTVSVKGDLPLYRDWKLPDQVVPDQVACVLGPAWRDGVPIVEASQKTNKKRMAKCFTAIVVPSLGGGRPW